MWSPRFGELIAAAAALVYPDTCQLCHVNRAGPKESFICEACRRSISFLEWPFCQTCGQPYEGDISLEFRCTNCENRQFAFSHARSAVAARGVMLEIIHLYKYANSLWVEPLVAELLVSRARVELQARDWDCLIPVPLHPARQRERGYNQASRLAAQVSKSTGIPVREGVLARSRPTPSQTRLSRKQRERNMREAFVFKGKEEVRGQRVVLIDDVFTTGATTNACARVLRQAGAVDVCVWTLARGT